MSSSFQFCVVQFSWILCTLVLTIGTFFYALRVVTPPWSLDQDRSWASCFWEVLWSFANFSDWEMETFLSLTFFLVFFSTDEEKKHVYVLEYFVDVWFFLLLWFSDSLLFNLCRHLISLRNYLLRLMSAQLISLTAFKTCDVFVQLLLRLMSVQLMSLRTSTSINTIARKVQSNSKNMTDDNELRFFAMSEAILTKKNYVFNDVKRTLLRQENIDVYWRYSAFVHFM